MQVQVVLHNGHKMVAVVDKVHRKLFDFSISPAAPLVDGCASNVAQQFVSQT